MVTVTCQINRNNGEVKALQKITFAVVAAPWLGTVK